MGRILGRNLFVDCGEFMLPFLGKLTYRLWGIYVTVFGEIDLPFIGNLRYRFWGF